MYSITKAEYIIKELGLSENMREAKLSKTYSHVDTVLLSYR